jgi:hypothetical protein
VTEQEQVNALYESQVTMDIERELAEALVDDTTPYRGGSTTHVSDLYEVILETGRMAFFKPLNGFQNAATPLKRALKNYAQTPVSAVISECAAWQLAKHLGGEWKAISTPTVIRSAPLPGGKSDVGALALYRPGEARKRAYFQAVPDQASTGAFLDCLSGQQDRNKGNVLWQVQRNQIYLIDHGFGFGRPGDARGAQELQEWRWGYGSRQLSDDEIAALEHVLDSEAFDLDDYVESDRVKAVLDRAQRMQQGGEMLFFRGPL